jgi:hypothetical protein
MQRHPAVKQRHPLGRIIADNYKNRHGPMHLNCTYGRAAPISFFVLACTTTCITCVHTYIIMRSRSLGRTRLLNIVGYSTSSVTRHRRLLNIVGYSTSSVTQHRQLLDIINLVHKRNKETIQKIQVY